MSSALRLYGRYVAASIRAQMAYPGSLAMMSLGQFLVTIIWAVVLVGAGGYLFRKRDA